jgi:3',5'-cyclic-AMP phosphodiesterase
MDRHNILDARELTPIVHRHPWVQSITAGYTTMRHAVLITICVATNHTLDLELDELRRLFFKVGPAAFHLLTRLPGEKRDIRQHCKTQRSPIKAFRPHPFFLPGGNYLRPPRETLSFAWGYYRDFVFETV